jgi:DNA repair protein SbcD/Mre11
VLRILHTADWHLGQTLRGYSRDFEHAAVLNSLIEIVQDKEIDVLLVAGDIFDSQHPSGESQALFYRTLARLHAARPEMSVVIIAGNHDSAGRLEAPHPLLESFNVAIVGNVRRIGGRINTSRHLKTLIGAGGDSILHILALSYPTAACLPPISSAEIEEEESNVIRSVRALYDELHEELSLRLMCFSLSVKLIYLRICLDWSSQTLRQTQNLIGFRTSTPAQVRRMMQGVL